MLNIFKYLKCLPVKEIAVFLAIFLFFSTPAALADIGDVRNSLDAAANEAFGGTDEGTIINDLPSAIGRAVGAVLAFVGVIFLILIIYGGFTWMVSRGNEQKVEKAKDLIAAAVTGLIIVLAAYAITSYLGGALTG